MTTSDDRGSRFEDRESRLDGRESRIDAAIDGAVRQMLAVEPPSGLRAGVLARIDARNGLASTTGASAFRRKHLATRKTVWTAVPLAAAATLILALLLPTRPAERQPQPPAVVAPPHSPRSTPPPQSAGMPERPRTGPTVTPPRVVTTAQPRISARSHRVVTAATFAPAEVTTEIAPLESITPIEVAPIAEHRVAPTDISVRPLTPIVEVQIAPLSPPERRN